MRAFLDVNVLIALLDAGHALYREAMSWLEREIRHDWASCLITQNGVVRIMSQPAYPVSRPPALVAERLGEACANPDHAFWADEISFPESELIRWKHVLGHRQATDAYLLALAARHQGRLVTFDRRISPKVIQGAMPEQLVTLSGETPITP